MAVLKIAGPGAGKTNNLVQSILKRLNMGESPFMMLATTFSRQAAQEIEERLDEEVPVRTIHGMGYWILRLARKARGDKVPRIITDQKVRALVERAIQEVQAKFIEIEQVIEAQERVRSHGTKFEHLHPQIQEVCTRYNQILVAENMIDFTGILQEAAREMTDPGLLSFLKGLNIWVDEGQDINPITEWPLIQALSDGSNSLTMYASPSQQIYSFRGADWNQLSDCFPEDLEVEYMNANYRSTPEIVAASKALAGPDAQEMYAARSSIDSPVSLIDANNPDMEADYLLRQINIWNDLGIDNSEIAVLCRVSSQMNTMQRLFKSRNIPFQIVGNKRKLFERPEILAALGFIHLANDPMSEKPLENIINFPPRGIGLRTRFKMRGNFKMGWDHLISVLGNNKEFRPQVHQRVLDILDLRENFIEIRKSSIPISDMVSRIIDLSGIPEYLVSEGDYQAVKALDDLETASKEFSSLGMFVEYLESQINSPRDLSGVQLSTIHSSKGREYDAVIIPGMQDGMMPLKGSPMQDERNLGFVGMSRAKNHLVLTMPKTETPSSLLLGVPVEVSQWPT